MTEQFLHPLCKYDITLPLEKRRNICNECYKKYHFQSDKCCLNECGNYEICTRCSMPHYFDPRKYETKESGNNLSENEVIERVLEKMRAI